eukprot:CAMPEP_0119262226 /NCGR_PEP_ID=MMETSP1329-20130426/2030_1 /TAXON_ID=114041 /ORGANISM="Genus nov. species nov., Strain RCC1024" /LENGTH=96 /DNA_ID=CAMNT_0007261855 /DNA_START=30 /DNA_END=317 /DNA_ORIENTATION=-
MRPDLRARGTVNASARAEGPTAISEDIKAGRVATEIRLTFREPRALLDLGRVAAPPPRSRVRRILRVSPRRASEKSRPRGCQHHATRLLLRAADGR